MYTHSQIPALQLVNHLRFFVCWKGADFFIDANDEISSIELGEFREALDVAGWKVLIFHPLTKW